MAAGHIIEPGLRDTDRLANRVIEVTNRVGEVTGGVLDSDASETTVNGGVDSDPDIFGSIAVAILKVAVDRQATHGREEGGMVKVRVAARFRG